jgi:hypothetical protein
MVNRHMRETQLAEDLARQQDVLALGERLFFDRQNFWAFFPDPAMETLHIVKRTNEVDSTSQPPAMLVNELESTHEGCRWLIDRWKELEARILAPQSYWRAWDKFKAIRLLGKQPLDVVNAAGGDLLLIFLASHVIRPVSSSPFSVLSGELNNYQFPGVRKRLEALDAAQPQNAMSEHEARGALRDLIDRNVQRLELLASIARQRAFAEAAERLRRLAFDPSKEADSVRRCEDIAIRRMTRACNELAKHRQSGMFEVDAEDEHPLELSGVARCKPGAVPMAPNGSDALDRYAEPAGEELHDGSTLADFARSYVPTTLRSTADRDLSAAIPGEQLDLLENDHMAKHAASQESGCQAAEVPPGNDSADCEAGVPPAESRSASGTPAPQERLAQNEATVICAGRAGMADRFTSPECSGTALGESAPAGQPHQAGCGTAERNETTTIESDRRALRQAAGGTRARASRGPVKRHKEPLTARELTL